MNRYEKAWRWLFNKLPNWKKLAIEEDRKDGKDSSVLTAFTKEVIALAEGTTKIPEVKYAESHDDSPANTVPDWHATNGANGDDKSF